MGYWLHLHLMIAVLSTDLFLLEILEIIGYAGRSLLCRSSRGLNWIITVYTPADAHPMFFFILIWNMRPYMYMYDCTCICMHACVHSIIIFMLAYICVCLYIWTRVSASDVNRDISLWRLADGPRHRFGCQLSDRKNVPLFLRSPKRRRRRRIIFTHERPSRNATQLRATLREAIGENLAFEKD